MTKFRFAAQAFLCAAAIMLTGVQSASAGTWPFTPRQARLVMLMDKAGPSKTSDGRQMWAMSADLTYRTHAGDTVIAPSGMPTDLASIPRLVQGALSPAGPYAQAALIHDACYRTKGAYTFLRKGKGLVVFRSRAKPYSRAECDDLLDQAMADLGIGWATRWTIWSAVRVGGASGFGR